MWKLAIVGVVGLLVACGGGAKDTECVASENCNLEPGGRCVANPPTGSMWCQYPDSSCSSGTRWSDFQTGDGLSGQCVASDVDGGMGPDGGPSADASVMDAGPADASTSDATPSDASVDDAMVDAMPDAMPDAGPCTTCPTTPLPISPANGAYTGSVHASGSLKPTFRWRNQTDATAWEIEIDDDCGGPTVSSCTLPSPEVSQSGLTGTTFQPAAFLPAATSAPVGTRYYWRVRACNSSGCSPWAPTRYLDVGRLRDDFNGDGYSDLLVGEILYDDGASADEGAAYIYFGKASWSLGSTVTTADSKIVNPLSQSGGRFGTTRAVGDVNGDGYADFLVMAPRQANPETTEGNAYLYFGRSSFPSTMSGADVSIDNPKDEAGALMGSDAAGGDLDGDGYADIVIVAAFSDGASVGNAGKAYVFRGRPSWPTAIDQADGVVTSPTEQLNATSPRRVAIGDVNGDGLADIVAGAHKYSNPESREGNTFIYFGRSSLPASLSTPEVVLDAPGGTQNGYFGSDVSVCDTNDDGRLDVIVGASGVGASQGAAYLYLGRDMWPADLSVSDATLQNPAAQASQFGKSISCGHVDATPGADILLGAVDHSNPEAREGAVFGYWGQPTWPSTNSTPNTTMDNPTDQAGTAFGQEVSAAKDLNGDGREDVVVGSNAQELVFIFFGRSSWASSTTAADITLANPSGQTAGFGAELD